MTFLDRGDGICSRCGRTIGWHAGTSSCFPLVATGMPAPVTVDGQLDFDDLWADEPPQDRLHIEAE